MISIHWLLFSDLLSTPVFNKWQMNPYDRSPAFGTFLTLICERPSLVWSWTLYCASLFELLCCNKIIILHFFFSSAIGADGLCCQSREFKEWHGCRSTKGVTKGKKTSFLCFLSKDQGNPGKIHSSHFFFFVSGKYYYEVACHDQGLCRVGWSTAQASLDLGMFSMTSIHWSGYTITSVIILFLFCFYSLLGTDKYGFGFGGTGKKSHNKQFDSYGEVRHK